MSAHDSRERAVEEATAAGLQIVRFDEPDFVDAQVGNWALTYTRNVWQASPHVGHGMPLAHALHLHDMPMPGAPWGIGPLIAGEVIQPWPSGRPRGTVVAYKITSVAGLCIFADYVRRTGLTEAVVRSEP